MRHVSGSPSGNDSAFIVAADPYISMAHGGGVRSLEGRSVGGGVLLGTRHWMIPRPQCGSHHDMSTAVRMGSSGLPTSDSSVTKAVDPVGVTMQHA